MWLGLRVLGFGFGVYGGFQDTVLGKIQKSTILDFW